MEKRKQNNKRYTLPHGQEKFYQKNYAKNLYEASERYGYFIKIMKKHNPSTILDLGCGDGSFAVKLAENFDNTKIYGIDVSQEAINYAKDKGIIASVVNIDYEKLPFKGEFFDFVFAGEIIEHLVNVDHFLEEIFRILSPEGKLLLTTPNLASWFNRISLFLGYQPINSDISWKYSFGHLIKMKPMGHLRLFTSKALLKLLNQYNFNIMKIKGMGIYPKTEFAKRHHFIIKIANFIFNNYCWNSTILILAKKRNIKLNN